MFFCEYCGNMLIVEKIDRTRFYCRMCPYVHVVEGGYKSEMSLKRKEVDDVLGGADDWKNVDSTIAQCPKCEHDKAYFMQIQIRSADEPATIFYKCCKCGYQWREG